jgi:hypothetical protein
VGVPIFLLNDTKIADNNNDLWDGSIDAFLNINENGDSLRTGDIRVWTGTHSNGTGYSGDNQNRNLGSPAGAARTGRTNATDRHWIQSTVSFPGN